MSDEDLIELVRKYPVIYNVKLREYRDTAMKNEAWEEISRIKHMSIEECKSMWTKLRNCYNNAIKRRVKKSGKAAKKIAPWRYEEQMSFLLPFLEGKDSWGNLEENLEENNSSQSEIDINLQSPATGTSPLSPLSNSCTPTASNLRGYNQRQNMHDSEMAEILDIMENSQNNRNKRDQMDDTDYFFLSMSHMLKKLPKLDQTKIKMDIHRAIHEAELRQLERHEAQRKMPITMPIEQHQTGNNRYVPYTIPKS